MPVILYHNCYLFRCFDFVCLDLALLGDLFGTSGCWMVVWQPADYVIVLGARVRGAKISNSLKQRLDRAIEYSEEYPNTVLVLSGGKGPGEEISEARAMYEY